MRIALNSSLVADACERSLLHMKRMNLRSSFAVALLLALILPILAACGGGTPAATEPTAAAPAAPTAAAPGAAEPTAAPAAEAPTAAAPAEQPTAEASTGGTGNAKPHVLRLNVGAENDN